MFYFIAPEMKLPNHDFPSLPAPFLFLVPTVMIVSLNTTGTNRIAHFWLGCNSNADPWPTITDNLIREPWVSASLSSLRSPRIAASLRQSQVTQGAQAPRAPRPTAEQLSAVGGASRERKEHTPTPPPFPETERGVSRDPQPGTGRATIFPDPPKPEVEPSQLAHSPCTNRMLSSGKRAQPRPPAAPLGCCIPTALPTLAHLVYSSRGPRRWYRKWRHRGSHLWNGNPDLPQGQGLLPESYLVSLISSSLTLKKDLIALFYFKLAINFGETFIFMDFCRTRTRL